MLRQSHKKHILAILCFLLFAVVFSAPILAASQNVSDVLAQLNTLIRVDIDPAWTPDVEANTTHIESMLVAYKKCTPTEKKEFTTEQNKQLKAYFSALYKVQGKSTAEIDTLFSATAITNSKSTIVSATSSKIVSSTSAKSSISSTSSTSSASSTSPRSKTPSASVVSAAPVSLTSKASTSLNEANSGAVPSSSTIFSGILPVSASSSPEISQKIVTDIRSESTAVAPLNVEYPKGGGNLFGNAAMGSTLLVLLFIFSLLVFFRFIAALRKAGKPSESALAQDLRAQELFGEIYEDEIGLPDDAIDSLHNKNPLSKLHQNTKPSDQTIQKSGQASTIDSPIRSTGKSPIISLVIPKVNRAMKNPAPPDGKPARMPYSFGHPDDLDGIDD